MNGNKNKNLQSFRNLAGWKYYFNLVSIVNLPN